MKSRFIRLLLDFIRDERGPTAVEYGVMLALIIVVCITAVTTLGGNTKNSFSRASSVFGGSAS